MDAVAVEVVKVVQEPTYWWQVLLSGTLGSVIAVSVTALVAIILFNRQKRTDQAIFVQQLVETRKDLQKQLFADRERDREQRLAEN